MENFVFHNPVKIIFGKNTVEKIGEEIKNYGIKKILFLYGKGSIKGSGVYDKVVESLKANGVKFCEVSGVKPNPVLSKAKEAIEISRKENVEGILAVGGGSVIDSAKAIANGFYYEKDVWGFYTKAATSNKALPIFSILTLSATGSEMNGGSVLTNEETQEKLSFFSQYSFPKISILSPEVQFSLPASQLVNGVSDIIAHVLELYFNGAKNTDIQDYLAEGIIKTVIEKTEILLKNPEDYEARAQFVWCGTLALNGLNGAGRGMGDWASHGIEHALSAIYDIAHGAGLSIIMPAWMEYVYKKDLRKFKRFAQNIFGIDEAKKSDEEVAISGIEALKNWYKKISLPVTLKDAGIKKEEIDRIIENKTIKTPLGTLQKLEKEDIKEILKISTE